MSILRWFIDADLERLRSFINVETYVVMLIILVVGVRVVLDLEDREKGKGR
jgi:hypothetical protein